MSDWNPQLYLQYKEERTQPSRDLVARITMENPKTIIDIGCGPGNSTQILRERWPGAKILGLDSSPNMIQKAKEDYPDIEWIVADAGAMDMTRRFDLVYSNATLQWIPDHHILIPKLFELVNPGGVMAVQLPENFESPLHQAMLRIGASKKWHSYTAGCEKLLTYKPHSLYYKALCNIAKSIDMWETIYYHIFPSHLDFIEFYRSTGMKPFLERLPDDSARAEFIKEVLAECKKHTPIQPDGKVLSPMRRLFFVAYK